MNITILELAVAVLVLQDRILSLNKNEGECYGV